MIQVESNNPTEKTQTPNSKFCALYKSESTTLWPLDGADIWPTASGKFHFSRANGCDIHPGNFFLCIDPFTKVQFLSNKSVLKLERPIPSEIPLLQYVKTYQIILYFTHNLIKKICIAICKLYRSFLEQYFQLEQFWPARKQKICFKNRLGNNSLNSITKPTGFELCLVEAAAIILQVHKSLTLQQLSKEKLLNGSRPTSLLYIINCWNTEGSWHGHIQQELHAVQTHSISASNQLN